MNRPDDRVQSAGVILRTEIRQRDVVMIAAVHGEIYRREYGFDQTFEAYVAQPLAECVQRNQPRERVWIAEEESRFAGCVGIVAVAPTVAQLRWFLVDPGSRGSGLGMRLLQEAIDFARGCDYESIFLWTVEELAAAAHVYRRAGFQQVELRPGHCWGVDVIEARYELWLK